MTERMPTIGASDIVNTVSERWVVTDESWYGAAADFAAEKLASGKGKCLVVGSPIPEAKRLRDLGWFVEYMDCRKTPMRVGHIDIVGDATEMPLASECFDAVSSTCVMCHAGLGRYGDPVKPNGDQLMLAEIARVLKPGGLATLMPGPICDQFESAVIYGNVHRIYTQADLFMMFDAVGLEWVDSILAQCAEPKDAPKPVDLGNGFVQAVISYAYLSVLLRKKA